MGVLIGFYLRALRICSPEHLTNELRTIETCFNDLKYPRNFLTRAKKKAQTIHGKHTPKEQNTKDKIFLPTNPRTTALKHNMSSTYNIITKTSRTIKHIVRRSKTPTHTGSIYRVPCNDCDKEYIGETGRNLDTRIHEHKRALRIDDPLNAIAQHRSAQNHQINFQDAAPIHREDNIRRRKLIEAATISQYKTFEQRPGSVRIESHLARHLLRTYKIPLTNT